jgi:hypothetical protein
MTEGADEGGMAGLDIDLKKAPAETGCKYRIRARLRR